MSRNLVVELEVIKENLLEMMNEVFKQIVKCKNALAKGDVFGAEQVITMELRVNALELAIDKDCENVLALHNPVATDLRFVLAVLRITNDLERIGDNAKSIAHFIANNEKKSDVIFIKKFGLDKMFDASIVMLSDTIKAFETKDPSLARKIFGQDESLDKKNRSAPKTAALLIEEYPGKAKSIVRLLSIVGKLERVGDLTVNVAEAIVFYIEAKVLKHTSTKQKTL